MICVIFVNSIKIIALLNNTKRIILGIDPGTVVMGYGLLGVDGNALSMIEMGVLKLSMKEDHSERLHLIYKKMETLMKLHRPTDVAIEAPFYSQNVQSMLKLGRAQGVAIAAAMMHGLSAVEYAPRKVKQSITGKGNAAKEQVWEMLQRTLGFKEDIQYMDASDALAVALCHYYETRIPEMAAANKAVRKKSTSNWASFIQNNPGRVKE